MRDFPGAGSPPLCVVAFFPPPAARAGVLEQLEKWECSCFQQYELVDLFKPRGSAHFFNGSNMPALTGGRRRTPLRMMEAKPFAPGKLRIDFHSHRECMEEDYEYANELGKQGGKNQRKIPKLSIYHERFSRTIKKNLK